MKPARIVAAVLTVLVLFGAVACLRSREPVEPFEPVTESRTDVEWADYDPTVQQRIDQMEADQDCDGLQTEFDTAADNSTITLERTGHGNTKLMQYLDEALRLAGCY